MGKSKKKEKYVPLTGLTGIGEDYNIYIMDPRHPRVPAVPAGKTPEGDPAAIPGYAGLAEQLLLCR